MNTRKKGMSWSKLTQGSRQLEDACQKIWVKLFRQSSQLEFPDRTRTWRKAALRSWVDEQSGAAPGKMMATDDEEGSQWPSWLHTIDPRVQSRLAAFKLRDLLPRAAWEQLEADGLSDFGNRQRMRSIIMFRAACCTLVHEYSTCTVLVIITSSRLAYRVRSMMSYLAHRIFLRHNAIDY